MATYVCGDLLVLMLDDKLKDAEAELIAYSVDDEKHELLTRRKALRLIAQGDNDAILVWDGVNHPLVRTRYVDEEGREREFIRVAGVGRDERGQAFVRFEQQDLERAIERLEYNAHVWGRTERGLPLGQYLEPRFQRRYYHMDETAYVLSLILVSLSEAATSLWGKYRVEPFGAVYATKEESDLHIYPDTDKYLPVTVIARSGDSVVFYNHGRSKGFRSGHLTEATDPSGDRIIEDREADDSALSALQLALDKEWNPKHYRDKAE